MRGLGAASLLAMTTAPSSTGMPNASTGGDASSTGSSSGDEERLSRAVRRSALDEAQVGFRAAFEELGSRCNWRRLTLDRLDGWAAD